jgi:phospholipase/lecithinase/hemolysin
MNFRTPLVAALAVVLLASCGGGGDGDQSTSFKYDKLVSFGDSLSDLGTFKVGTILALTATQGGGRWSTSTPAGGDIWVERVASQIAVSKPCSAETGLLPNIPGITGAPVTAQTGCFSYSQGSARITSPLGPNSVALQSIPDQTNGGLPTQTLGLMAKPIKDQMAAHLAAAGGSYSGQELVTVLAGANDVFMELSFIGTGLGAATPAGAFANMALSGATLGNLIKTEVLAKGAKRVMVLNIPDVASTPFAKSRELTDPGTTALIDAMVKAFNTQLATALKDVPGVRLGDAYSVSKDQATNPAAYGLTNVTSVACGTNFLNGSALVCNGSNLIAGDTSRYQFADDVHPTAYGHQLLAQFAIKELAQAGWL